MITIEARFTGNGERLRDAAVFYCSGYTSMLTYNKETAMVLTWALETDDEDLALCQVMDCIDIASIEDNGIELLGTAAK